MIAFFKKEMAITNWKKEIHPDQCKNNWKNPRYSWKNQKLWKWIYKKVETLWEGYKIWKNQPPVLTNQLFLLSSVKICGRFFQIFVAFSEKLNFNVIIKGIWWQVVASRNIACVHRANIMINYSLSNSLAEIPSIYVWPQ